MVNKDVAEFLNAELDKLNDFLRSHLSIYNNEENDVVKKLRYEIDHTTRLLRQAYGF